MPVVSLELGTNVNASSIREGADVYFECNIKSTPWVYKVNWRHNVSKFVLLFIFTGFPRMQLIGYDRWSIYF